MSALEEYRKYVDEVRDDYSEYNPAFHIILKADAAIAELEATVERLTWMVRETWGQGGMEYGPPDFFEYMADLERRWQERQAK